MNRYNFNDLVKRHSVSFKAVSKSEGEYIGGRYQEGTETVTEHTGAIIPLSERKIHNTGGSYTAKDRNLYMTEPLTGALKEMQIRYKGNTYSIEEEKDFSDYSDVYVYLLRWVSSFD